MVSIRALAIARRRLGLLRVAVSLAAYLLACAAFLLVRQRSPLLGILAALAFGLLAIRLHRVVRDELAAGVGTARERRLLVGVVGGTGAALLAVWLFGGQRDGVGFFGLVLLYLAIGLVLQELRRRRPTRRTAVLVTAGAAGLAVASTAAVAAGLGAAVWPALAAAVLGVPFGLSLASEEALGALLAAGRQPVLVAAAGGAVLLVGGLGAVALAGAAAVWVGLLAALTVAVMVGIAARSSGDVVLVVVAAAVVWTLSHQAAPEPGSLRPGAGDRAVAALGDSFISGEGADVFFAGTNDPGRSTCRRAPTAHPALLVLERHDAVPRHLAFLACSGAVAREVAGGDGSQLEQLAARAEAEGFDVAFVLVSAGGNDALFGTIAQACLLPIDCTRLEAAWVAHLAEVEEALVAMHDALSSGLPGVPVAVVPYPVPVADHGCRWSAFSAREHRLLHRFTGRLNDVVVAAAARAGRPVVDTVPGALAGLRLCDGRPADAGVNFLAAHSVLGTLEQSVNPANWVHNSLHPNARGHEAMRAAVVAWLEDHPDPDRWPAATVPSATTAAPGDGRCVGAGDVEGCTRRWMARESARLLLTDGAVLVPVLAGGWLLALALVGAWRALFGEPDG